MKTVGMLGAEAKIQRKWDADPVVYGGWRTKPIWLRTVESKGKTVHIAGLGDVGLHVALGLVLTGASVIGTVGLYDLNKNQCLRLEKELSQIAGPSGSAAMPAARAINEEELFDCDIFLFCATKSIPAVGSGIRDVRMAQYEANRGILASYAEKAAMRAYKGLFVVVSDPVDLLCMEALRSSRNVTGEGRPLTADQIFGCGLGVMHARASWYARQAKDTAARRYLSEGRAFGPHGEGLVIANSTDLRHYDNAASEDLTEKTVLANMEVRELGFKPFLAPAMSSAVLTLLAMVRGEWNYSAAYLNGLYFGALNRQDGSGTHWEEDELPDLLYARLERSYRRLEEILWN